MALIKCSFMSKVLSSQTDITVVLPFDDIEQNQNDFYKQGTKFQTLYLLHGLHGDHSNWTRYTCIERYAGKHKLAVIMPSSYDSCYCDMVHGKNYWTYISEELPSIVQMLFPLSDRREDNFVAGISMGGYGALKIALSKPDRFAAAASISGTLDIVSILNDGIIPGVFDNIFDCFESVEGTKDDLFYLLTQLKKSGTDIPQLYQACGTDDFLYKYNLHFRDSISSLGINLTYEEGPGSHEWNFWDEYIKHILDWFPLKNQTV